MKCPHCLVEFHDNPQENFIGQDNEKGYSILSRTCPSCLKMVLELAIGKAVQIQPKMHWGLFNRNLKKLVYPKSYSRTPIPVEVPKNHSEDFKEACLVLNDSPKASAALSRRCLQNILREKANIQKSNLANEIQEAISSGKLPSHITESLDAIRNIGNFAAHPIKSQSSGEIVDVEPGEAEWNLDVIESLFDFYFVQPEIITYFPRIGVKHFLDLTGVDLKTAA